MIQAGITDGSNSVALNRKGAAGLELIATLATTISQQRGMSAANSSSLAVFLDLASCLIDVLCDQFAELGVPVLGGLPIGHGPRPLTVPLGTMATLDIATGTLTVEPGVR